LGDRVRLFRTCLIFAASLWLAACATADPLARRPLIMISMDGFRADYLDRGITPTLSRLAAEGAHASGMRPSFPALTYPNHYTLVTGLRPDHHGLVHNIMQDKAAGLTFGLGDRVQVRNPLWWEQGEPLWVTAGRAGRKTASMFWPGDETLIHARQPDRWRTFDQNVPAEARVDQVLQWFDADRPDLTTLYFDDADTAGHGDGPDSPRANAAIVRLDAAVARLLAGLKAQGLGEGDYDLLIMADHGMVRADTLVFLDDAAKGTARIVAGGGTALLEPLPGQGTAAEKALIGRHEHMTCWNKTKIPARYHYGTNARVPPIVCLGDTGWYLTTHAAADGKKPSMGQHGFDPYAPQMAALFIAHGPAFKRRAVIRDMDNVDVYPLAMHLLRVAPRPNDGQWRHVVGALK
jgi:predicted AlkP superfamily pyrophosphatase or phosphodiesterase